MILMEASGEKDIKCQEHIQEWNGGSTHYTEMAHHSPTCNSVPTTSAENNPRMDDLEHPLESTYWSPGIGGPPTCFSSCVTSPRAPPTSSPVGMHKRDMKAAVSR